MKYCSNCGTKVVVGFNFCGECGFSLKGGGVKIQATTDVTIPKIPYKRINLSLNPRKVEDTRYFYLMVRYYVRWEALSDDNLLLPSVIDSLKDSVVISGSGVCKAEKGFVYGMDTSDLCDLIADYIDLFKEGDFCCLLGDVNIDSTLQDLVGSKPFYRLVMFLSNMDKIKTKLVSGNYDLQDTLGDYDIPELIAKYLMGYIEYDNEDSQEEYFFHLILKMCEDGVINERLQEYIVKYFKAEYKIEKYEKELTFGKNEAIELVETAIDMLSPTSAAKRFLKFFKDK